MASDRPLSTTLRPYRSHEATAACLDFSSVDDLYAWYRSDMFRPFWNKFNDGFLKKFRSTGTAESRMERGPGLDAIIRQIKLGEEFGKQRFSGHVTHEASWLKDDWYAYLAFKIVHVNTYNEAGLFYKKNEPNINRYYQLARYAILNYIRYSNIPTNNPIIPESAPAISSTGSARDSASEILKVEGVTVVWKNANDQIHGYPLNVEETESIFHLPLAFSLPTTASIRNRVRDHFGLNSIRLEIARLFLNSQDDGMDDYETIQLTNEIWSKIRSAIPGTRSRIYVIVETRSAQDRAPIIEHDDSLVELPATTELLDAENECLDRYINKSLDFTGTYDPEYTTMEQERQDREWSLEHRICQYETLFNIASLTQAGNPNADVVWESETMADMDVREANQQSNVWRKQLELLGSADGTDKLNHHEQAAAAGTLQFQDITSKEKAIFEEQELWLDNVKLQLENEDEAYTGLDIHNRTRPHISGMNPNTILKFWQVVAVWGLYQFHRGYLKGGVLADAVGLGKTIVVLSLIQFKCNLRSSIGTARERVYRYGQPKPTMIVVPPTLIPQWIDNIREHLPGFTICIYYGGLADNSTDATKKFIYGSLHKGWFDTDESSSRCIILTSYKTMARRHGPGILQATRLSQINIHNESEVKEVKAKWTILHDGWDRSLKGCIGDLFLDEGHAIKSGEASSAFIALKWLEADYTTVVTATPMINSTSDFEGILGILQRKNLWTDDELERFGVGRNFNPFTDVPYPNHNSKWLCCTPQAMRKYVTHKDIDVITKGTRLLAAMELCVIKRGYGSSIPFGKNGRRIGDSMQPMQVRTIELNYRPDELVRYRPLHNHAIANLPKTIDGPNGTKRVAFDMKYWRSLKHYSTWLGFEYLLQYHVDKLQEFRSNADFTLRNLADFICENNPKAQPPGDSLTNLLEWFADGSPKIRWMCWVLAELTVKRKEKIIIWVQFPWQQELLYLFLKELNIDVRQYHSGLSSRDRQHLVKTFHEEQHEVMVLICSYSVNSCGLNLHGRCRNVLIFEPAPSSPVEFQAVGRVYRVGQELTVRVIRLYLQQSWNEWEEGNGLVKELPALMAELNMNIFGANEDSDDDPGVSLGDRDISIRRYVVFDKRIVPAEKRPELDALSPEDLLMQISTMLKNQRNFRSTIGKQI
ncbi:MAG: hypothetical protein M1813_002922 [Trichoglossum hirsutum]|nr:MAG: hypothetical protein M1813_002922 [Trichoglossum hirsutum]